MITKGYANTPLGQIHFRTTGKLTGDQTPIVMLHQTASSSAMWEKVITHIDGALPTIAFDTPGFGNSFDPEGYLSIGELSEVIVHACDDLGIDAFHLLGHHTGVCLAAEIAVAHPSRTQSVMMIGPVPLTAEEREEFRTHFSTPFSPDELGGYLTNTWNYLQDLGGTEAMPLDLMHREVLDTVRAHQGRFLTYSAVWDQDFTALFEQIDAPLLLMCAEKDVLWPFFERACDMRTDAQSATVGGSNFEPDQDPAGVTKAVLTFLNDASSNKQET